MSMLATRPLPPVGGEEAAPLPGENAHEPRSGGCTLEERLDGVLGALREAGAAECPVCAGTMTPGGSSAVCTGCGSTLD
jgi:hypothetical protein